MPRNSTTRTAAALASWAPAVAWVTMPFVAGPALAAALGPTDDPFRAASSVGLWAAWAVGLVAAAVRRPTTLTIIRVLFPAALVATTWAAAATPDADAGDAAAIAASVVVASVALAPAVGERFVDGASYGPERRMPLRPPGWLVAGPIELAWAAVVAGLTAGPLLLAAEVWWAGGIALVVGWPLAALAGRALHRLAERCVVLVPAGLVVVDPLVLDGALPLLRPRLASLGPAPADTTAHDLTAGALGLAVEIRLHEPQALVLAPRPGPQRSRGRAEPVEAERILITPSRPGALLAEARRRGLSVA